MPLLKGTSMTKLTRKQLDQLEQLLQTREQAVRAEIRRVLENAQDFTQVAGEAPDAGDVSLADLVVHLGNEAIAREIGELREIDAARERMRNGVYGKCAECGRDIPFDRLLAQPIAHRCTPCQGHYEKTHADAGKKASL